MNDIQTITECVASLAALFLIGYVVYSIVRYPSGPGIFRSGVESRDSEPGTWWEYEEREKDNEADS